MLAPHRRLVAGRREARSLLYEVARHHEKAVHLHVTGEQVHLRAVALSCGDVDAHVVAATRNRLAATRRFSVAERRRKQAWSERASTEEFAAHDQRCEDDDAETTSRPYALQRALEFIDQNAAEHLTIADIAAAVHFECGHSGRASGSLKYSTTCISAPHYA
jgi:hypothetical protein